jgi:hypothetical protein
VISSASIPVCASQNLPTVSFRSLILYALLALTLSVFLPSVSTAESLKDAAASLAQKTCAMQPQKTINVRWVNTPEFAGESFAAFQKIFLARASECGFEITENGAAARLSIAVQVTASQIVFVAELATTDGERKIRIVELPRSALSIAAGPSSSLRLRAELLWQQEAPLNGAIEWSGPDNSEHFLLLLSEGLLTRMRWENQKWVKLDSAEIVPAKGASRFPQQSFAQSDPSAPVLIVPQADTRCFVRMGPHISFDCKIAKILEQTPSIVSTCDGKSLSLATGTGDFTQPDSIFPMSEGEGNTSVSSLGHHSGEAELPGPALQLVANEGARSATVLTRNLSTGIYEVYRITTVCGK